MQILEGRQINGRWYLETTPVANWNYRKQMLREGMGYVEIPHPKGKIVRYVRIDWLQEIGTDQMGGETLPRYDYV